MSRKILLCLPFSPHEIPQARELLRLWVDLEDTFNNEVTLLLFARYDILPTAIGQDMIDYARTRFKVLTQRCKRVGKGWPHGCNELEVGAYEWFVEQNRGKTLDFEYILLAEADTVPLRKGWVNEIMNEAYDNKSVILGAYFTKEDGVPHINGNCVIHRDFWKNCKRIWAVRPREGWDVAIGKEALALGTPSRLIWQDYQLGMAHNPWRGPDYLFEEKSFKTKSNPLSRVPLKPAMLHGCKDMRGIEAAREKLLKKV